MRRTLSHILDKQGLGILFFSLCLFFINGSFAAQNSGFDKTTTGVEEDTNEYGGIGSDEINRLEKLDRETAKQANEFKKGRESSGVGGVGRMSNELEMHDDYAGVTYHAGPANGLEGRLDKVATKGKNGSEAERQKALSDNTNNAPNCENGNMKQKGPNGEIYACKNLSPVLLDMGAAHGGPDDPHRVYQMTDEAQKESKAAGQGFAASAISDATSKTLDPKAQKASQAVGDNRSISSNAQGTFVTLQQNGKSVEIQQSANVDLLRSEFSWLEQQKRDYADRAWKTLRAARLAGVATEDYGEAGDITEFNSLVSNSMGEADQNQKIAQRVAERNVLRNQEFCLNENGGYSPRPAPTPTNPSPSCPPLTRAQRQNAINTLASNRALSQEKIQLLTKTFGDPSETPNDPVGGEIDLQDLSQAVPTTEVSALYDQARAIAENNDPNYQKNIQEKIDKIIPCLDQDKWCVSPRKADDLNFKKEAEMAQANQPFDRDRDGVKEFSPVDEPGDAFDDTREFMYTNYSRALRAPMAKQLEMMTTMDFSSDTDSATGATVYGDYKKEWEASMEAYREFAKMSSDYEKNGVAYGANGLTSVGYKDRYNSKDWNADQLTQMQLFGRNATRDASFTSGLGVGNFNYNGDIEFNAANLRNPGSAESSSASVSDLPSGFSSTGSTTAPSAPPSVNQSLPVN